VKVTHNNIKIFLTALVLLSSASCDDYTLSEDQKSRFVKYYPTSHFYWGEGFDLIQRSDGGYLIAGNTFSGDETGSNQEIMIIRTDEYGREEPGSPVLVGTPGHDYGYDLLMVQDGFIIVGSTRLSGKTSGYLVKLDQNGQYAWDEIFSTPQEQEFNKIIACSGGGFVLTGYCKEANGDKQVCLVKINPYGDILWEREIGFTGYDDIAESVIEYQNRFIIAVTTTPLSPSAEDSRLLVFNTNDEGKGATQLRLAGDNDLSGKDMAITGDGRIMIMGMDENSLSGSSILFFAEIKLEGAGNEIVTLVNSGTVNYPGSLYGESMIVAGTNIFAVCGYQQQHNDRDILLVLVNQDLQLNAAITFGDAGNQASYGINRTMDGGYILTGGVDLAGSTTTTLIKVGADGKL